MTMFEMLETELTEEEAKKLMGREGRLPARLMDRVRAGSLDSLPNDMPEADRKKATDALDELIGELGQKSPVRFAVDSLLSLIERERKRLEDLPGLAVSLARMLEASGLDAPHMFRLGGVYEALSMASALLQSVEKDLREVSKCACFPGNAAEAPAEKAAPE